MDTPILDPSLSYADTDLQGFDRSIHKAIQGISVLSGAVGTLLGIGILEALLAPHIPGETLLPWFLIWLVVQTGSLGIGLYLVVDTKWRKIPTTLVKAHIQRAFGVAWLAFLALPIRFLAANQPFRCIGPLFLIAVLWGGAMALPSWRASNRSEKAEDLFP